VERLPHEAFVLQVFTAESRKQKRILLSFFLSEGQMLRPFLQRTKPLPRLLSLISFSSRSPDYALL
jgi:hypothetical protein